MLTNFESKTNLRVRYGETDQMGYCYYGNYAQYFEVGRVEALREAGLSYREMEERGIMLPVSEFMVKYKAPAYYDDLLTIVTKITEVKGPRIYFDYRVYNDKEQLLVEATTILVFVAKENMRPTQAPEEFINLMQQFEVK